MKVSTKGRYGLRAMVDIASQEEGVNVPLNKIAERQGISENYLEQIISTLRKAGYVKSIRGAQGGYTLNVPAETLKVGDILRELEGSFVVVDCNNQHSGCGVDSCKTCVTKDIWERMQDSIDNILDNVMLSDLVNDYLEKIDDLDGE